MKTASHWHLKNGWVYSSFIGDKGGWTLRRDGYDLNVVRKDARTWSGYMIRYIDGRTTDYIEHTTRNGAMRALMADV